MCAEGRHRGDAGSVGDEAATKSQEAGMKLKHGAYGRVLSL